MGRLRLGATLTIGNYLAVPLMARFMREHEGAEVTLTVGEHRGDRAPGGELRARRRPHRGGDRAPRSRGHALARRRAGGVLRARSTRSRASGRSSDDDLRGAAWIVRERGSGTRQTFDRAMRGLLPHLHIALELQHTEAIKGAVEAGLGHRLHLPHRARGRVQAGQPARRAGSRSATSGGSSSSCCTSRSTAAPASSSGWRSAAARPVPHPGPEARERCPRTLPAIAATPGGPPIE